MALLEQLQKRFGKDGLFLLEDGEDSLHVEKVPTGVRTLDAMLGGGLPKGKIIEISGQEGVGKTSLCLQISRHFQEVTSEGYVVYIDVEGGNSYEFLADTYGLDPKRTIYKRVQANDTAQQVLDFLESVANEDEVILVILDSLASLVSEQDGSKDLSDGFRDDRPQLYARCLRRLSRRPNTSCPVVIINQLRVKQNAQPGEDPWYETGGQALKYYPSLRMRLFNIGRMKDAQDVIVGFKVKCLAHKARYSLPRRSAEYVIDYEEGVDTSRALLDLAIQQEVVKKKGAWLEWGEQKYQGMAALLKVLREDDALLTKLENQLIFTDDALDV